MRGLREFKHTTPEIRKKWLQIIIELFCLEKTIDAGGKISLERYL